MFSLARKIEFANSPRVARKKRQIRSIGEATTTESPPGRR